MTGLNEWPPLQTTGPTGPHLVDGVGEPEQITPFRLRRVGKTLFLTRVAHSPGIDPAGIALGGEGEGGRVVGMVEGGRVPHPVVELEEGTKVVIKEYLRGGAVRHLNRARYFVGHRAIDEAIATERARAAGVRVPEVLAAIERRHTIGYTAHLITRLVDRGTHGEAWLRPRSKGERTAALIEAGRQVARMHAAGIAHPDLNLRNLLIVEAPGSGCPLVYLLDFDRARLHDCQVPPSRRADDLERLGRSARKLGLALEDDHGWCALREGYGDDWPLA